MPTPLALAAILALGWQVAPEVPASPAGRPRVATGPAAPGPVAAAAIPHDPPPHEGALIDIPGVIGPPDLLVVEVLEALPGRPITGERLVRPDGTISLGFYGSVHVRGLSAAQAKAKIILHLRAILSDESLGLAEPAPAPAGPAQPGKEDRPPGDIPTSSRRPGEPARARTASRRAGQDLPRKPEARALPEVVGPAVTVVDPADSTRVFVDVTGYNSQVYYVQGDVGVPGRLPITGKDTVLDALNFAGGLIPTAEPRDVHLYRPAGGGAPARDYSIDLDAIRKGDARANLQLFPNDRLVVGRDPTVQKTIELDRAAAPLASIFNSLIQQTFAARSVGAAAGPINGTTEAGREAILKAWADFLWTVSSKGGGAGLDEKAFREAVMKRLSPDPEPKK